MKSNIVDPGGLCNAGLLFATALACFASPKAARAEPLYSRGDWLLGISAAKVFTGEKLDSISAGGLAIPGAGIDITNDTTLTLDVSYFLSPSVAINFFGGFPASADLTGEGSVQGLPVGETKYGPAALSLQYHFATNSGFGPYLGIGVARVLFMDEKGDALTDFDLEDAWAPAIQIGLRYQVNQNWLANFDLRYIPFETDVSGGLGGAPVDAKISVDPIILNAGFAYRF
jgi:outer membrane protein